MNEVDKYWPFPNAKANKDYRYDTINEEFEIEIKQALAKLNEACEQVDKATWTRIMAQADYINTIRRLNE